MKKYLFPFAITHPDLSKEWSDKNKITTNDFTAGVNLKGLWNCPEGHEYEAIVYNRVCNNAGCPYCSGQKVCEATSIFTTHPHLIKIWSSKNIINPKEVSYGSYIEALWDCGNGHEWQEKIYYRSKSKYDCPFCAGQKPCKENCLATLHPDLMKEWADSNTLDPFNLLPKSSKIGLWQCPEGHLYEMRIYDRTVDGNGCPYCSNHRVFLGNCLATTHSYLIYEWHPANDETPYDVIAGSNKKKLWICQNGHVWRASIANRAQGHKCIYCTNQKVCKETCLATKRPDLVPFWSPNNVFTPFDVFPGTHKKGLWICENGHEYSMSISKKCNGQNCPYCPKNGVVKKVSIETCLATTHPEIVKIWSPKNTFTPFDVSRGSVKTALFFCEKGHEYEMVIGYKTSKKPQGCPFCSGKRVCLDNCLATKFPHLIEEWSPNNDPNVITPWNVMPGTLTKALFVCENGHEYLASIASRTGKNPTGCPKCRESKGEKKVRKFLKENNIYFISQFRFADCKNQRSLPFDFYVENKFLIEYQGEQHYKLMKWKHFNLEEIQINDKIKFEYCQNNNIPLLIIPYWDFNKIELLITDFMKCL